MPTAPFTVLAADKLAQEGLDWLASQPDATVLNKPGLTESEYADLLAAGGIHAMIVRSGIKVTPAMLENPGDLQVIARAGVGVDNIDLPAATAKGILVVNTAEASTITTAELAFTLLMAMLRKVGPASRTVYNGGWDRAKFKGRQLHGMTIGVVGLGRIGRTFAERALAFGMNVVGYDPFVNSDLELGGHTVKTFRDFTDMLPHIDAVSFHVPKTAETTGMLNAETFKLAKPGLFVVNAARGGIVDEAALLEALDHGQCAGAALDVYTSEPPSEDSKLRTHPGILAVPHLGASTEEAQTAVSVDAGKACLAYLRGEGITGAVNAGGVRVDLTDKQSAYVALSDRMATLIAPMITRGIAEVNIELCGADLAPAAGTIERTVLIGLLRRHFDTPLNVINVADVAKQRNIKIGATIRDGDASTPGGMPSAGQLTLTVTGPASATDANTPEADRVRRVVGRVYDDGLPRVVEINGYPMDMVPAGPMVVIRNEDTPGIIGTVGTTFGAAGVNIADMTIARRASTDGSGFTALMLLKLDGDAPETLLTELAGKPGIRKVAAVRLAPLG
ncbi:MAG: phosphoglycerate dehydrogenase [Planctomycetota bacterium]